MRVRTVVGLFAIVGCNTPGSIELIIPPSSHDVDRVQLFVGVGDSTMEGIAPQGADGRINTTRWDRDEFNELSHADGVGGKQITFGLEGPSNPLSIVIAVGFDVSGKPIAAGVIPDNLRPLTVPNHSIARYTLPLEPLASIDPASHIDARVWKPNDTAPGDKNQCVIVIDKQTQDNLAVVTPGDQDCDGWPSSDPSTECVKTWFNATRSPRLEGINCLVSTAVPTATNGTVAVAVLGGDTCVDGTGPVHGCAPSNYCLPRSVAELCSTMYSCAQDLTARTPTPTVTHMQCNVAHDDSGKLCEDALPGFTMPGAWLQTRSCKTGSIKITRPGQAWGTQVDSPMITGTITTSLTQPDSTDCQFTLTPKGPGPTANLITWGALVAGDLDNGRGIAIPYVFSSEPSDVGCGNPMACVPVFSGTADGLAACIAGPALVP